MLRGILTYLALALLTPLFALPLALLVLLVPRWSDMVMRGGRGWGRAMLAVAGARVSYVGLEHMRAHHPCIFISNHQSMADIWALIRVLPPSTRFVAKAELFRIPVFGWALSAGGFVPIRRQNRVEAVRGLTAAASRVRAGRSLLLFAEGTRSRDGRLAPFKKGAFHLALEAGVPVVPVAIRGSYELLPPGTLAARPGPIEVHFGPPLDVSPFQPTDSAGLLEAVRAVIERCLAPGR